MRIKRFLSIFHRPVKVLFTFLALILVPSTLAADSARTDSQVLRSNYHAPENFPG